MSWLNSDHPLRLAELRGRVVLLNFWVFTCGNCTRTVAVACRLRSPIPESGADDHWHPHPEFHLTLGSTTKATSPRAQPTGHHVSNARTTTADVDAYDIHYWPSFILIDKRGMIRYNGVRRVPSRGRRFRTWDQRIQQLIAE